MTAAIEDQTTVCVCGFGSCTPLGMDALMGSFAYVAGISRISSHPFMIDLQGENMILARAEFIEPDLTGSLRMAELAQTALDDVLTTIERHSKIREPFPLIIEFPPFRPGFSEKEGEALLDQEEQGKKSD